MKEDRPYGSWPSQLTSEQLANGATRLSEARAFNGEVLWLDGRPAEAGRTALVKFDGASCETLGPPACVRVLLRAGCNPDSSSPGGSYPLLSAASSGHLE